MGLSIARLGVSAGIVVIGGIGALLGYRGVKSDVEAEIYKERLAEVVAEYEGLRETFNNVVRRTAVTELVVVGGEMTVRVRTAQGVVEEVETRLDPRSEVYVDFAVVDGRALIRRVFDEHTPPSSGVVIDGALEFIDWDTDPDGYGQAVYRSLGEGRWIVTVTGSGALGLKRVGDADEVELVHAPGVRDFGEIERGVDAEVQQVGVVDVLKRVGG